MRVRVPPDPYKGSNMSILHRTILVAFLSLVILLTIFLLSDKLGISSRNKINKEDGYEVSDYQFFCQNYHDFNSNIYYRFVEIKNGNVKCEPVKYPDGRIVYRNKPMSLKSLKTYSKEEFEE